MAEKKRQCSYRLPPKTIEKIESINAIKKGTSKNTIVEQAIDFYYGYLTSELSQDYLCSTVGQKIDGSVNLLSDRMGRNLFKVAVETNTLTRVLAAIHSVDRDTYNRFRKAAVDDAKATKGIISINEV